MPGRRSASGARSWARRSARAAASASSTSSTRCASVSDVQAGGVRPQRPVVRRPRLQPRPGRPGERLVAGEGAQQRGPPVAVGVGDQQQRPVVELGRVGDGERGRRDAVQHRAHLGLGHDHRGQGRGRLPVGALGGGDDLVDGGVPEQVVRDALEQPLPDPAGGGELVGVARHRGRGLLVDVGEDELGEVGEHVGAEPCAGPRWWRARARPPARRSGTPRAARRSCGRCVPRPGRAGRSPAAGAARTSSRAAAAGQGQEAAQGELDRAADRLAHRARERVAVAGHLVDDRGHHVAARVGSWRVHRRHRLGRQPAVEPSGAGGASRPHLCLL